MTRIVLAYSEALVPAGAGAGGASGHDAIAWLAERYDADVVTLTLDFGQGRELEALRDRALASGAARAHVLDVAAEFAADYVVPTLKAGALVAASGPRTAALSRLIIAAKLVEIAAIETTTFVAHGWPPADAPLPTAVHSLDARLTAIGLPSSILASSASIGSRPMPSPPRRLEAASIELTFVGGAPTAINGVPMPLVDLVSSLEMLVGVPRGGQFALPAAPSAVVLHQAHQALQTAAAATADGAPIAAAYGAFIERGTWFSPERRALDQTIDTLEERVNGTVRLQVEHETCQILGTKPLESRRVLRVR
jgi:argininosuccinate synthase